MKTEINLKTISDSDLLEYVVENYDFDNPEVICAAIKLFDVKLEDIEDIINEIYYPYCYQHIEGCDYTAGTDKAMDKLWDENLESYIDNCLEMKDTIRPYFDNEKWKKDARMDGRGHSLNYYDGGEEDIDFNGTTYYFYRTN